MVSPPCRFLARNEVLPPRSHHAEVNPTHRRLLGTSQPGTEQTQGISAQSTLLTRSTIEWRRSAQNQTQPSPGSWHTRRRRLRTDMPRPQLVKAVKSVRVAEGWPRKSAHQSRFCCLAFLRSSAISLARASCSSGGRASNPYLVNPRAASQLSTQRSTGDFFI